MGGVEVQLLKVLASALLACEWSRATALQPVKEQKAGWTQEMVSTVWRRGKTLTPAGIPTMENSSP